MHHVDLNPLNNDIINLELLPASEHIQLHKNLKSKEILINRINKLESQIIVSQDFDYHIVKL